MNISANSQASIQLSAQKDKNKSKGIGVETLWQFLDKFLKWSNLEN